MKPRIEVHFTLEQQQAFIKRKPTCHWANNEFPLNHGRSGLLLALQALHLSPNSKVGMMVYNCHTVMNAIAQAGCEIVFIDVDDHLHIDMDDLQKKSTGLEVLVVTHLFGIINDVRSIQELYPNMVIIEDCAHAYGKEILGNFGIYSIGQGKFPSLGDGGILIVNGEKLIHSIKSLYRELPSFKGSEELKLFCNLSATSLLHQRQIYSWITFHWKRFRKANPGKETIVLKKMSERIQSIYELEKGFIEKKIELRRKKAEEEAIILQDNPLIKDVLGGEKTFMLIIRCTNTTQLKEQYRKNGIEVDTHFKDCILWAKRFGYKNDCPNAERLVKELIMVPLY